jgi:hypothetical protein
MGEMSDGFRPHMGGDFHKVLQKFGLRIFKDLTVSET